MTNRVRNRIGATFLELNVDVWKDDVPRESVSRGVWICVSGCCGGVIPSWEFGTSGIMVRIWVSVVGLGAMG